MPYFTVALGLVACEGPNEIVVNGVTVCVDVFDMKYCEKDLADVGTASEQEPGGPFAYCEDVFEVDCAGQSVVEEGENFTANHSYYANSEEDCETADGGNIGG